MSDCMVQLKYVMVSDIASRLEKLAGMEKEDGQVLSHELTFGMVRKLRSDMILQAQAHRAARDNAEAARPSDRPPAVDLADYQHGQGQLDCKWVHDRRLILADLEATRRERDELIEQADKVYLLLRSAVAKAAHAAQRPY